MSVTHSQAQHIEPYQRRHRKNTLSTSSFSSLEPLSEEDERSPSPLALPPLCKSDDGLLGEIFADMPQETSSPPKPQGLVEGTRLLSQSPKTVVFLGASDDHLTSTPPTHKKRTHRRSSSVSDPRVSIASERRTHSAGKCMIPRHRRNTSSTSIGSVEFAESDIEKLKSRLERQLKEGIGGIDVGQTWNELGNVFYRRSEHKEALKHYRNALECVNNASHTELQRHLATTKANLGTAYWTIGELDEAARCLEESLEIRTSLANAHGRQVNRDVAVAASHYKLGLLHCLRQDHDKALSSLKTCEAIQLEVTGDDSIDVARTVDAMGKVYLYQDQIVDALHCHQQALRIKRSVLGKRHSACATSLLNLAAVHRARCDFERALDSLYNALSIQRQTLVNTKSATSEQKALSCCALEVGMTLQMIAEVQKTVGEDRFSMDTYTDAFLMYKEAGLDYEDEKVQTCVIGMKS